MIHFWSSADISIFTGNHQVLLYQEIQIKIVFNRIISSSFNFFGFLKVFLINIVPVFIMSAKLTHLGLLEIKVFWNKDYDVINYFHDVINNIFLRNSNYIADVVMWLNSGNSSLSMREVIITSILLGCEQKNQICWGILLVQVQ